MISFKRFMAACVSLTAALACDEPQKPAAFGSIAVQVVSTPTVSTPAPAVTATAPAKTASAATATLALDGVRVTVTGPTNKTASSTNASGGFFDLTLDQLAPGQYTVTVEGIVNGQTDYYGSVSSVAVTAGQTATATISNFATFVPVLADFVTPTGSNAISAKWSKVPTATGYILQVSNNASFSGSADRSVPDTSAVITAPDTGLFYVRVRSANSSVQTGRFTAPKTFRYVPVPSTLQITPTSATLVGSGTQQTFTAQAKDANGDSIANLTYVWASNPAIATLGSSTTTIAQATAVAAGQTTVSVTAGTATAATTVNVAVTGAPAVNVWSTMPSTAPSWLWSVWGLSPTNVFAVGAGGTLLNFNGTSWSAMTHTAGTNAIRSVWGPNASDLFAVVAAASPSVMHYNDTAWSSMTTPGGLSLYGVWGSSSRDVFAVGVGGNIIHYDGNSWTAMTSPTTNQLWHVWGSSASDVFACGGSGTILHYNGTSWTAMTHPGGTGTFYRLWGTASDNVFVVGLSGVIMRYNGSSWSLMTSGTAVGLYGITGTSSNEVFAGGDGGTVLRYNGTSWSPMTTETTQQVYGMWASPTGPVFAVTETGTLPRVLRGGRGAPSATYGEPTILGTTPGANWATDYLISVPITVSSTMELTTLAMIGRGPANQGRMALYTDNSGTPDQLVAQTAIFNVSGADPTTYEVPLAQQARIAAGTYWLTFIYNNATGTPVAGLTTGGGGYKYVAAFGFGTAFPQTYPAVTGTVAGYRMNYYAKGFTVP